MPARMPLVHPGQVRRRHQHAQSAVVAERELALERAIKLARPVVMRPDAVLFHAPRHEAAGKAQLYPLPPATPQVMRDLPWADAADHAEHQRTAGFEQTGAV